MYNFILVCKFLCKKFIHAVHCFQCDKAICTIHHGFVIFYAKQSQSTLLVAFNVTRCLCIISHRSSTFHTKRKPPILPDIFNMIKYMFAQFHIGNFLCLKSLLLYIFEFHIMLKVVNMWNYRISIDRVTLKTLDQREFRFAWKVTKLKI